MTAHLKKTEGLVSPEQIQTGSMRRRDGWWEQGDLPPAFYRSCTDCGGAAAG